MLAPVFNQYGKTYTVNLRLGYLYNLNKQYANAEQHYKSAQQAIPTAITPYLGLMSVYQNKGQLDQAASQGQQLLKMDSYNYYGNLQMASIFWQQKKYTEALKVYQKMLGIYPTDTVYLAAYGELLYAVGDVINGQSVLENLLIIDPENTVAKKILKR
jgi:tetratricopeptide (TPR) repeat protein